MKRLHISIALAAMVVTGSLAAYTYEVNSGWNLLGATENITDFSEFAKKGPKIWKWNGAWEVIDTTAASATELKKGEGFWFVAQGEGTIESGGATSSSSSEAESSSSSTSSSSSSSSVATKSYKIVDTDQKNCYNSQGSEVSCSGSGQDGAYSGNQMSYTKNGDVVTDNVTGLMWQQSGDMNGDGTININDKITQSAAESYCSSLSLGGYDDWRLPDIKTIYSLMNFNGEDMSVALNGASYDEIPFIDTDYFEFGYGDESAGERAIDSQWATTTIDVDTVMGGQECMFGLNLADGRIKCYPTFEKTYYVYCVRQNESYGVNNFSDNGDGTVNDSATGLMWQQDDSGSTKSWDDAISYCEALSLGGSSDWRLPNAKELQSIVDYTRAPGITNSASINAIFSATSITNEAGQSDYGFYWSSTTHKSTTGENDSAVYVSFGRALGYMSNTWMDVHGAGAQRSDPKDISRVANDPQYDTVSTYNGGTALSHGPQGDVIRGYNFVRCVRDAD